MNTKNGVISLLISLLFVVLSWSSGYSLYEGQQVVITFFGRPVRVVQDAGLHWKLPFLETIRTVDLRILNWDGYRNQIPTRDKKYIDVDATARWRIIEPLKFIQTVQSETGARSRLDAILDASTRDIISSHNLVEAVRNSDSIFESIKKRAEAASTKVKASIESKDASSMPEEEEVTGEIERISIGREQLSKLIIEKASKELLPIGIELIDVQIRRVMYEQSVQKKVYLRMISERERIAEKIRSTGKGEQSKIEGKTNRDVQEIQSSGYKAAQKLKGDAEAKAIAIYASTLSRDPAFYDFMRKLEVYKATIKPDTKFLLSEGSEFFDVLRNGKN